MSNRKLQGEIDRVLKRVEEGIVEFSDVWDKCHSCSVNLKDKYEGDLKKEIKKLQRFRDQIKTWASSSEVKNKQPLLDARKNIETEMERFKVLERQTKTKAYSKEGLQLAAKNKQKKDAANDARYPVYVFLDSTIESLTEQTATLEQQITSLRSGGKKVARQNQDAIDDALAWQERHQHHIRKAEEARAKLQSRDIHVSQLLRIQEDITYYLEDNQDPDFIEDEELWSVLDEGYQCPEGDDDDSNNNNDDDDDTSGVGGPDLTVASVTPVVPSTTQSKAELKRERIKEREREQKAARAAARTAAAADKSGKTAGGKAAASTATSGKGKATDGGSTTANFANAASSGSSRVQPVGAVSYANLANPRSSTQSTSSTGAPGGKQQKQPSTLADMVAGSSPAQQQQGGRQPGVGGQQQQLQQAQPGGNIGTMMGGQHQQGQQPAGGAIGPQSAQQQQLLQQQLALQQQQQQQTQQMLGGAAANTAGTGIGTPPGGTSAMGAMGALGGGAPAGSGLGGVAASLGGAGMPSDAALGVARRAPFTDTRSVTTDYLHTLGALERSLAIMPDPSDCERPKQYVPRNPYRTPACFPSVPAAFFDDGDASIFEQFDTDTLFFIFYFQQGTSHQYLAARELKKQSWRYHKNFLTWFQRHDDPVDTTDEYEQGTYVYFDYETGWCQRIKTDFTFEYRYLEDELTVPISNQI